MSRLRFLVLCVAALVPSAAWSAGVVVSSSAVSVPEGGTNTFTVRLDAAPASDVSVAVSRASGDVDVVVTSPASSWEILSGDQPGYFDSPESVALGPGGVIYVVDSYNDCIQVRAADGSWSRLGGYGSALGSFSRPCGIAVDGSGCLYVADCDNHRVQTRGTNGVWTAIGERGAGLGQFEWPHGVAIDSTGNLYVADTMNHRIQRRSPSGVWTAWGEYGSAAGQFFEPTGIAIDAAGSIYVADNSNNRVQRRSSAGVWTVWGQPGSASPYIDPHAVTVSPGGEVYFTNTGHGRIVRLAANDTWVTMEAPPNPVGSMTGPHGVCADAAGNLLVCDSGNRRLLSRSAAGVWAVVAGAPTAGRFWSPAGLCLDGSGRLYVADRGNDRLQRYESNTGWQVIGSKGSGLGEFLSPAAVAVDGTGALYVADQSNNRVQKRDAVGIWSAVGVSGTALGQFREPSGLALDSAGRLVVAEAAADRVQLRSGAGVWSLLAGPGSSSGQVDVPSGLAVDAAGNLFVADTWNRRVQRRDAAGGWTEWLGGSGWTFGGPTAVSVDAAGNLYVSDSSGDRVAMRACDGTWSVLATYGGALGQVRSPAGVAADGQALYVADTGNNRIQRLVPGLRFTNANWAAPQTVTLRAAEDIDTEDGVATVTCHAAGLAGATVTATEIDNDRQSILATVNAVTVPETGSATFGVKLSKAPTANVSVSVGRTSGDNNLSVTAGATLTFTTANWNTAQTVTVGATDDTDAINGAATISASASGWASAAVTATEADNDLRLVVSPSTVTVPEGGSATYGVSLAGQPGGDVKVGTVRQSGDTSLTISAGAALTFTAANWSVPQTVRVAAASDADTANGSATLVSSATGWAAASVTATEADDDMRIVATPTSLSVPEGGTATYTLVLAGPPTANVTVSTTRLSGDADLIVDLGASMTFTTSNWNVPKTVRLRGASDADAASGSALFRASAAGWSSADVTATELDDEMRIVAAPTSVSVAEGGTGTFAVSLGGAPASSVVVRTTRLSGDASLAVDLGAALTFTSANWSVPQTVRLRASEDADAISGTATMQSAAAGWASANVTATAADNDLRILATPTSVTVPEAGSGTYAVTLAGAPASSVTVSTARIGGDSNLALSAGSLLTFTTSNWHVPQTVRVSAAADSDMANGTARFQSSATGWTPVTVTATEADDDKRIVVTANEVTVPENGSVTYSLRLGAKPPGNVTVTTSRSGGDSSVSVDQGAQLTFTPANWNVTQQVRLRAADDVDAIGSRATLRSSASGWAAASVTATEADDDLRIIATPTSLSVPEGGTATCKVSLAGQPSASVTVRVARVAGDSNVSVDLGATLTFTPSNWKAGQTVRLRAAADSDALNGVATIRASSAGWLSAEVRAVEADARSASEFAPTDPCAEERLSLWQRAPLSREAWSRLDAHPKAPVCIAFRQLWYE